jgi:hypothetical protein
MLLMFYPASLSIPSWRTRTVRAKRKELRWLLCPVLAMSRVAAAALRSHGTFRFCCRDFLGATNTLPGTPGTVGTHPASNPNNRILAVASLMAYRPFPDFTQGRTTPMTIPASNS